MTNLADSVKAGVKGIHGAGEVIRGETLDAADRLFDNNNHPATIQNESKNQTIAEKGRQDIRNADETFAAREWERENRAHNASATGVRSEAPVSANAPTTTTAASGPPPPLPARNVENTATGAGYEQRTGPAGVNQAGVTRPNEQVGSEMGSSTTGGRY